MQSSGTSLDWTVFGAVVVGALLLDALVFGRKSHTVSFREASIRSGGWISLALLFGIFVQVRHGTDHAVLFITAYLVEESLSVDNLFVFLVVFKYFKISGKYQHRVLLWGIVGAVVMRLVFILAGTALLSNFHWMIYVFGAFLIFTGLKLAFQKEDEVEIEHNIALRIARRFLRTTHDFDGDRFFTYRDGVRYATPLFLVLVVIEFTDVVFAVDSVPAVLAITPDLFIVYTSNIFAILGLRSLFFLLAGLLNRFRYLDIGVALVLVMVGAKMVSSPFYKVPNVASLVAIASVLAISVFVSMVHPAAPDQSPRSKR